jgi:hypothetical protein
LRCAHGRTRRASGRSTLTRCQTRRVGRSHRGTRLHAQSSIRTPVCTRIPVWVEVRYDPAGHIPQRPWHIGEYTYWHGCHIYILHALPHVSRLYTTVLQVPCNVLVGVGVTGCAKVVASDAIFITHATQSAHRSGWCLRARSARLKSVPEIRGECRRRGTPTGSHARLHLNRFAAKYLEFRGLSVKRARRIPSVWDSTNQPLSCTCKHQEEDCCYPAQTTHRTPSIGTLQ